MEFEGKGELKWGKLEKANEGGIGGQNLFKGRKYGDIAFRLMMSNTKMSPE